MTSRYSHRSQPDETSLCLSPNGREGPGRVQTVEGLLDAFKRVAAEKGIDLCGIRLSCGELERELTFAETGTGDTYEVKIHLLARKRSRFEQPGKVTTAPV